MATEFLYESSMQQRDIYRTKGIVDRIVVSGTHGTGKTTLCKALHVMLSQPDIMAACGEYQYFEEPIREMRDIGFPINQYANDVTQLAMATEHAMNATYDRYIADRCIVDVYAYAKYLSELPKPMVSEACVKFLEKQVYRFIYNFHGVALVPVANASDDIEKDDVRDTDVEFRNGVNSIIVRTWIALLKPEVEFDNTGRHGLLFLLPDGFSKRLKHAMGIIAPDFYFNEDWYKYV